MGNILENLFSIENIMLYIWLGVFLIALIVELSTNELVSLWFIIGSIVALILSAIPGIKWYVEVIIFIVVSVGLLLAFRPFVRKFLDNINYKSNSDSLIGQKAYLEKEITKKELGEVKIKGISWRAASQDNDSEIKKGSHVLIVAIEGNTLIVKNID